MFSGLILTVYVAPLSVHMGLIDGLLLGICKLVKTLFQDVEPFQPLCKVRVSQFDLVYRPTEFRDIM